MTTTGAPGSPAPSALVIEDDADVRALLHTHLVRLGWRVSCAASGEEGVALAFVEVPDVVVVDVVLPSMDGRDVVRTLRGQGATRDCRIVVTTVLEPGDLDEVPFDALLPKPFSRRQVEAVLGGLRPAAPDPVAGPAPAPGPVVAS